MVDGEAAAPAASGPAAAPAAQADNHEGATAAEGGARARRAQMATKETVQDELAQETRRHTLLDAVEHQLKSVPTRARLLLACNVSEDKKLVQQIEAEFSEWVKKNEQIAADAEEEDGTPRQKFGGLFIMQPGQALHFMEGSTEQLFAGLKLWNSFSIEVPAGGDTPARSALLSNLRIIYFTEVHGVQTMVGWNAFAHTSAKSMGGPALFQEDSSAFQAVFMCYRKLMVVNSKTMDASSKDVKEQLKKLQDNLPTLDEVTALLHKTAAEFFFTYAEFDKAFCAPFHLVLQSELLWPMPPPLSY